MRFWYLKLSVLLLLLSSCSYLRVGLGVAWANYQYRQGLYQQANYHYMKLLPYEEYSDRLQYNIGTTNIALGEQDVALSSWEKISKSKEGLESLKGSKDLSVRFRYFFNRGVVFYQQNNFKESYSSFVEALKIKPKDHSSKINLELALSRMIITKTGTESKKENTDNQKESPLNVDNQEDNEHLLDFMKYHETFYWEKQSEVNNGEDW